MGMAVRTFTGNRTILRMANSRDSELLSEVRMLRGVTCLAIITIRKLKRGQTVDTQKALAILARAREEAKRAIEPTT